MALGAKVNEEDFLAQVSESGTEVDGDSGLADTAFLIAYGHDLCHRYWVY
jgi:hypothetical protein